MPPGSKRRKAVAAAKKKKKEQESPTLTPSGSSQATTFNGGDDVKGQESDVGEVSSPASQNPIQSGAQSFNEEVVEKKSSPVPQIDPVNVNVVEVGIVKVNEDEGRVEITRELDEVLEGRKDLSVEIAKNSDGSSSSSSLDDDEEVYVEKTEVVLDSAVPAIVLEEVVETADASQVPTIVLEEVVETAEESQVPAIVLEEVVETAEESQVPAIVLDGVGYVSEAAPVEKLYEDLDKPALSKLDSELKETEDNALPVVLLTVVSQGETSNVDPINVTDAEDNVLPPSDSPLAATRNGVGHHPKDPEIQDSPDNQAPVLQAPLSAQKTSWKGCCGLFEVFTG